MKRDWRQLADKTFDLLVCGGGVYGAWTAYDAALRGLKVALIDQGDWAGATSSASSKLVHGGLRYLETYDFRLVKKALSERQMLLEAAPHRVWPLRFGVPVYADSRVGRLMLEAGLFLYDFLAGFPGYSMSHHRFGRNDFSRRFSILESNGLKGGFTYSDAQTDDARLVLEIVDGAMSQGAACVNYCRMESLIEQDGKAIGAILHDCVEDADCKVYAKQIVNATGCWMSQEEGTRCRLTKGVHLVMPETGLTEALLLTAKSDGRVFFVIPWYGRTLLGTTDTDYRGNLGRVKVETEDIAYLLAEANRYLNTGWNADDVIGSFAGLRTLIYSEVAAPSAASRDWKLETAKNGVHYSVGGKLTSAREDAARIVDAVCTQLGMQASCATRGKPFPWVPAQEVAALQARARQLGVDEECTFWLIRRHGRRVENLFPAIETNPALAGRIVPDLPFTHADLLLCARDEMVVHLDDLLRRRLPLLILSRLGEKELRQMAERVAPVLGWDQARIARETSNCVSGK
ncbi:MAG TPA: glycerol-3-phosphate dehydrogenase/oxidase [Gallionellaceae bacterium]